MSVIRSQCIARIISEASCVIINKASCVRIISKASCAIISKASCVRIIRKTSCVSNYKQGILCYSAGSMQLYARTSVTISKHICLETTYVNMSLLRIKRHRLVLCIVAFAIHFYVTFIFSLLSTLI